jgi:hypothetical protein
MARAVLAACPGRGWLREYGCGGLQLGDDAQSVHCGVMQLGHRLRHSRSISAVGGVDRSGVLDQPDHGFLSGG